MPCFKGLAVSIHADDGPLPEYSIQKQARLSRISSYIPVPAARINPKTGEPEQSTFAVSITLLTPGQPVPYSRPSPTISNPDPQPKIVGRLPGFGGERGRYSGVIGPYIPLTASGNETIAAYIYFDGRAKEEVATLLRRSEETWVNSRWVSVPETEGGGLAEREFLFREVGLERWLNGLDLQGPTQGDKEKIIERRKRRLERQRRKTTTAASDAMDDDLVGGAARDDHHDVLSYGADKQAPLNDEDDLTGSDSDDPPMPEAAGQIKVALFRVMASGEIKRGEYSPQFDAHDDEDMEKGEGQNGSGDADVDHTTSFAKPKTLDPASISTQTVTGIDPPDKPYATFTFFYRGQKQLQKMGILTSSSHQDPVGPHHEKSKSGHVDFSSLAPLKANAGGTVGFSSYRETTDPTVKRGKGYDDDDDDEMDSDDERGGAKRRAGIDGADDDKLEDVERRKSSLTEDELKRRAELADGMKKIQLKRQLSFEPQNNHAGGTTSSSDQAATSFSSAIGAGDDAAKNQASANSAGLASPTADTTESIASPYKKQRASVSATDELKRSLFSKPGIALDSVFGEPLNNVSPGEKKDGLGPFGNGQNGTTTTSQATDNKDQDEEL